MEANPPGKYRLRKVSAMARQTIPRQLFLLSVRILAATALLMSRTALAQAAEKDKVAAKLVGRVTVTESGEPVGGAKIYVLTGTSTKSTSHHEPENAVTDTNGYYSLPLDVGHFASVE